MTELELLQEIVNNLDRIVRVISVSTVCICGVILGYMVSQWGK